MQCQRRAACFFSACQSVCQSVCQREYFHVDLSAKINYRIHMAQPLTLAYKAADMVINEIAHSPGGYQFWYSLPAKGRHSAHHTRKKIAHSLLGVFFPQTLITALLTACLSADGTPEAKAAHLYTWMVRHLYAGHSDRLYKDWLLLR